MGKRLWDLAKSRIEITTILPGHRHKVAALAAAALAGERYGRRRPLRPRLVPLLEYHLVTVPWQNGPDFDARFS